MNASPKFLAATASIPDFITPEFVKKGGEIYQKQ